jgi:Zn-dependent metalloprotease
MFKRALLILGLLFPCTTAVAAPPATTIESQATAPSRESLWKSFVAQYGSKRIERDSNGVIRSLYRDPGDARPIILSENVRKVEDAVAAFEKFLSRNSTLFGVNRSDLHNIHYAERKVEGSPTYLVHYDQIYKGIPVEKGVLKVEMRGAQLTAIYSNLVPDITTTVIPSISMGKAEAISRANLPKGAARTTGTPYLMITAPDTDNPKPLLAWRITYHNGSWGEREHHIDALTGKLLRAFDPSMTAAGTGNVQ